MIKALRLKQADQALSDAISAASSEMPQATFVFVGLDNDYIYFNVVAKMSKITDSQMRDITEKTSFVPISIQAKGIYKGEFKMTILPYAS